MTEQSLKDKTAKGLFWGGLSNGMQQLLNLIFGIALARILDAEDYGMIGMLSIFSLIASTLQESGFTAALANKKNISHEDYNAVFWFSLFTSGLLYILLFFLSPYIAEFYHTPALIPLARYTFLGFFIASLGIAHNAYLFRNLKSKTESFYPTDRSDTVKHNRSHIGSLRNGILGNSNTRVGIRDQQYHSVLALFRLETNATYFFQATEKHDQLQL